MEYEFIHDAITGDAKARFSSEHEVIGPWIEVELGSDSTKLRHLLTVIDDIEKGIQNEVVISGYEYTISINRDDVEIHTNASLDGIELLPEMLTTEHIHFDENEGAACGIDDFKELLVSWAQFNNNL